MTARNLIIVDDLRRSSGIDMTARNLIIVDDLIIVEDLIITYFDRRR